MNRAVGTPGWQMVAVPTGVPNLDRVVDGGLTRGGTALIVGGPGTGKTVLAEQMAFHWAREGKNVLWLVLLGEPNEKFLTHLSGMSFFDASRVGTSIQLINLTRYLRQGFEDQLAAIRETIRSGAYSFVVIDGFQGLRSAIGNEREVRLFLSELSTELALAGITLIVTADEDVLATAEDPELTIADCIIHLRQDTLSARELRQLEVLKLRGRQPIGGPHNFTIDDAGVHVHPRVETVALRTGTGEGQAREETGLPGLDSLLNGGLLEGTTTLLAGDSGAGMSVVAAHFLAAGVRAGEPCLCLSLFEDLDRSLRRADAFGLPLRAAHERGLLQVQTFDLAGWDPDSLAESAARAVTENGIRRLVVDGLEPIADYLVRSERSYAYAAAVTDYLRRKHVTALFTVELPDLLGRIVRLPDPAIGRVADNLILLRFAEVEGRLRRFLTVVKARYSQHSTSPAELLLEEGEVSVVPHPGPREAEGEIAWGVQRGLHEGERFRL